MPDLGLEAHVRWPERVVGGNLDVNQVLSALVWCVGGAEELAQQVCEVIAATCRVDYNLRVLVIVDVG